MNSVCTAGCVTLIDPANYSIYMDLWNHGATNVGENVRYIHIYIHMRAVVTINVELAQAHPNYIYSLLCASLVLTHFSQNQFKASKFD